MNTDDVIALRSRDSFMTPFRQELWPLNLNYMVGKRYQYSSTYLKGNKDVTDVKSLDFD